MSGHIHVFNVGTGLIPKSLTPHCALDSSSVAQFNFDACSKGEASFANDCSDIHPFEHFY